MSPSTRPVVAVPPSTDTKALVEKQREYFETRVTLPLEWRREQLQKLERAARKYEAEILAALKSDLSKSPEEAYLTEVGSIYGEVKNALKHVKGWMKPRRGSAPIVIQPARAYQYAEPLGVTLIIVDNFPLLIGDVDAKGTPVVGPLSIAFFAAMLAVPVIGVVQALILRRSKRAAYENIIDTISA